MSKQLSSIEAFEIISEALQGLPPADKVRVLKAVATMHGLESMAAPPHAPPPSRGAQPAPVSTRAQRLPNRKKCSFCNERLVYSRSPKCNRCEECRRAIITQRQREYMARKVLETSNGAAQ